MQDSQLIGNRLKIFRISRGLKQKELAAMINCDRSTICRYETGKQEIPASVLFKLAGIFECSTEMFNPVGEAIAGRQFFN